MRANVLIQTVITFEILKSYRGFCICVPIKDYTFPLGKLELSTKSQIIKISFQIKGIFSLRSDGDW